MSKETPMLKCLKTMRSHTQHACWLAETSEEPIGWLARTQVADIPSPYAYSPVVAIWEWNGKPVILRETAHRKFQVFEVPDGMQRFKTADAAEAWFIKQVTG